MTESPPQTPGGKRSTGTDLSEAPEGYPPRFTAYAPDLATMRPETPEEFTRRGWIYFELQEYEKAESDFRRALVEDPQNPDILYPLAKTLEALDKREEAIKAYQRTIEEAEKLESVGERTMLMHLARTHITRMQPGSPPMEP